jgi:hypothetical protein
MASGITDETFVNYLLTHTFPAGSVWDTWKSAPGSLYPYSVCGTPLKDEFLNRIREHCQVSAGIDPLDGTDYDLNQIAEWVAHDDPGLRPYELALRFIVLGAYFDVFELDTTSWDQSKTQPQSTVDNEMCDQWILSRVQRGEKCRFKCKAQPAS